MEYGKGTKAQRSKGTEGNTNAFSANGAPPYQPGATPQDPEPEGNRGCGVAGLRGYGVTGLREIPNPRSPIRFWRRPCLSVSVRVSVFPAAGHTVTQSHSHMVTQSCHLCGRQPLRSLASLRSLLKSQPRARNQEPKKQNPPPRAPQPSWGSALPGAPKAPPNNLIRFLGCRQAASMAANNLTA